MTPGKNDLHNLLSILLDLGATPNLIPIFYLKLPSDEFQGLWESLIYDDDIKEKLVMT